MTRDENVHPRPRKKKEKKKKFPIKDRKKANEENSQSKIGRKENSRSKIGRKQKKYTKRSLDHTIFEQYKIVTGKQEKKGKHEWKWSSPFDYQPKSCAPMTFLPRTKQK